MYRYQQVFRNIRAGLSNSLIKLLAWVIAFVSVVFGALFTEYHYSFDKGMSDYDKVYRLQIDQNIRGVESSTAHVFFKVGPALSEHIPQLGPCCRVSYRGEAMMKWGEKKLPMDYGLAEPAFFQIFTYPVESAIPREELLLEPYTAVLEKDYAVSVFGDEDPVGQVLFMPERGLNLKVTALVDVPENAHLQMDILVSASSIADYLNQDGNIGWNGGMTFYNYYKLIGDTPKEEVEQNINAFFDASINADYKPYNISYAASLHSLEDVHLRSKVDEEFPVFSETKLWIIMAVVGFILLIAFVNHINLSIVDLYDRSRSYGVMKVMGADRKEFGHLLFIENLLVILLAFLIAIIFAEVFMPLFVQLTGVEFSLYTSFAIKLMIGLFILVVLLALFLTYWPSKVLDRLSPQKIILGINEVSTKKIMSQLLMGVQFLIAALLINATLVFSQQFHYINKMDNGFDKENVLIYEMNSKRLAEKEQMLCDQIAKLPEVQKASISSASPGTHYYEDHLNYKNESHVCSVLEIGKGYLEIYNFPLLQGRFIEDEDFNQQNSLIMVNKSFANVLHLQNPVGHVLTDDYGRKFTIVGMIDDIRFRPGKTSKKPLLICQRFAKDYYLANVLNIKYHPSTDIHLLKNDIAGIIAANDQDALYTTSILEEQMNVVYQQDQMLNTLIQIAAAISLLLACLSLFGISQLIAKQQLKEVAIKKILGASLFKMTLNQLYKYLRIVLLSGILALPLSWFLMQQWLEKFPERMHLNITIFLIGFLVLLSIAILSVMYRVLSLVRTNPLDVVRKEN